MQKIIVNYDKITKSRWKNLFISIVFLRSDIYEKNFGGIFFCDG